MIILHFCEGNIKSNQKAYLTLKFQRRNSIPQCNEKAISKPVLLIRNTKTCDLYTQKKTFSGYGSKRYCYWLHIYLLGFLWGNEKI